jgi:hypothetical protein
LAEELGYESLWVSERVLLPDLPPGEHRWAADLNILDPMVFLGYSDRGNRADNTRDGYSAAATARASTAR